MASLDDSLLDSPVFVMLCLVEEAQKLAEKHTPGDPLTISVVASDQRQNGYAMLSVLQCYTGGYVTRNLADGTWCLHVAEKNLVIEGRLVQASRFGLAKVDDGDCCNLYKLEQTRVSTILYDIHYVPTVSGCELMEKLTTQGRVPEVAEALRSAVVVFSRDLASVIAPEVLRA